MGDMMENTKWNMESEIDEALRSAPLVSPPGDLFTGVMSQIKPTNLVPAFHITWLDLAVSCTGSLSVAVFLAFFVFMPAPLRSEARWLAQWVGYLGQVSLVWILPLMTASGILAAGFMLTRSVRFTH